MSSVLVLDFKPVAINVRDGEESSQIVDVVSSIWGSSNSSHVMPGISAHLSRDIVDLFGYDGEGKSQLS
jgi:hypothetical protein